MKTILKDVVVMYSSYQQSLTLMIGAVYLLVHFWQNSQFPVHMNNTELVSGESKRGRYRMKGTTEKTARKEG